jgi:hypothetical protein
VCRPASGGDVPPRRSVRSSRLPAFFVFAVCCGEKHEARIARIGKASHAPLPHVMSCFDRSQLVWPLLDHCSACKSRNERIPFRRCRGMKTKLPVSYPGR